MNHALVLATVAIAVAIVACAPSRTNDDIAPGKYHSRTNAEATVSHEGGVPTIMFHAGGNPADGVAIGADCEMKARFDRAANRWILVPFSSEMMTVAKEDIADIQLKIARLSSREFEVWSDYESVACARGVRLAGRYRR